MKQRESLIVNIIGGIYSASRYGFNNKKAMKVPKEKTKEKRRQLKWEREEVSFLTNGDRRRKKENILTGKCKESRKCKESFKEMNNKTKNIFQIKIDTLITTETITAMSGFPNRYLL